MSKDESSGGGLDADMSRMRGYGFGGGGASSRSNWKSGDWICTRLMHINIFVPFKSEKHLICHLPLHVLNLNFTGPVATSTTLLAGLNAIDAMHPENLAATSLPINHRYR